LRESDALRLAEYVATHEPSPIVTGCALALFAGLGTGECCGLRWRNVDFKAGTMRIDEAIGNGGAGVGYYSKEPKVKSRRRTVPLAPQLAEALRRRRDLMIEACAQMGMRLDGSAYVLGTIDGRWLAPITLSRGWSTLADAEGYKGTKGERVGFYGLRHHFATAAIAQGGDVEATAAILGHSNVAMTLDTYADASPAAKLATVERVSRALEGGNQGGAQNA
jgi:integrase